MNSSTTPERGKEERIRTAIEMIIKGSRIITNPDQPFDEGFELIKCHIDDIPKRFKIPCDPKEEMTNLDYATVMALADSPHIQAFKDKLAKHGYTLTKS